MKESLVKLTRHAVCPPEVVGVGGVDTVSEAFTVNANVPLAPLAVVTTTLAVPVGALAPMVKVVAIWVALTTVTAPTAMLLLVVVTPP